VNLGVHDLDLAAYLTRSPLALTSATGQLGVRGVEERANVLARTASGAAVHVLVDQRPPPLPRSRSLVVLTKAHAWHGDLLAPSLARVCRTTGVREDIPLDTCEPLLAQALAFAAAVGRAASSGTAREITPEAAPELATGEDGMRALVAAERATRAVRETARAGENLAFRARI
jgi:predicted dehydrogenase